MFREKKVAKIFAPFFAGVYLFVVLFSQNFHHHGSGEVFKDFHFKKSEKTYTINHQLENYSDCLSCHILHAGNSLLPQDFNFILLKSADFQKEIVSFEKRIEKCDFFNFQLRGPPANFI